MNRNIAFFVSSNKEYDPNFSQARDHLTELSREFGHNILNRKTSQFNIFIVYEDNPTIIEEGGCLKFQIGNLDKKSIENDRFLDITIKEETISIKNDYAGSIPVYFSQRNYLSLSNIEPCVVLDSKTEQKDLSLENIYGFMRYMHFIWDETAYRHIYTTLPDSRYTFNNEKLSFASEYLKTAQSSQENINLSDKEVAKKLHDLNSELVQQSLSGYDSVILPLSSGYDSRMILAALSEKTELLNKLYCFTYGSLGSVEVEAGRMLAEKLKLKWNFVDLPRQFLKKDYLQKIHSIFGSSLHMHGMYQLEFFNEIKKITNISQNSCLTSGFMTGVPAGQHNLLLKIDKDTTSLTEVMNKFSQSGYWTDEELERLLIFKGKNYLEKAEERFRHAFNRFEGEIYQKAVMFDIWTRQRNFIGYYPRTLEWEIPTVSPHMNINYVNFFMSLSKRHLDKRFAVELMFKNHYPELSSVISNSNGLYSLNNKFDNFIFSWSRIFRRLKLNRFLPQKYANNLFDFDLPALRNSEESGLYPLLENKRKVDEWSSQILERKEIKNFYQTAYRGDISSYQKLISLQSLALSVLKLIK